MMMRKLIMQGETKMANPIKAFNVKDGIIFWIIASALVLLWLLGFEVYSLGKWIHLVLLLALLGFGFGVHRGLRGSLNIDADRTYIPNWDPARPNESLKEIHDYAIDQAIKSMDWYWKHKGAKALFSQTVRFFAWVLAAVSGILPILANLYDADQKNWFHSPLVPSLLLGIAAALLGLDKAFGYSTGWARYVLTATNIRKILEQFRLDWAELMMQSGISAQPANPITAPQVAPLIECAMQFRTEVENQVLQETKDWITEFQTNTAQLEKDIATQIANLKTQVDKTIAARTAANQPGTIQLTVADPNNKAGSGGLQITLIDSTNKTILQEPVILPNWASRFIAPGTYQMRLTLNNAPVGSTPLVTVASGASATANITI
jgi:SMODS and SLOG-associating 2TM effector domain 2/Family of unknown function (DUF5670)